MDFLTKLSFATHLKFLCISGSVLRQVSCNPDLNDRNTLWNVEYHENKRLPKSESVTVPQSTFWQALVEVRMSTAGGLGALYL